MTARVSSQPEEKRAVIDRTYSSLLDNTPGGEYVDNVRITSEIKDGIAIVTLSGRLVFQTAVFLREEVRKRLDAGTKRFIFNVSDISYCDSAGCGELIDVFSTVGKASGLVAFLKPSERVHELWARIRLTDIFNIFDTIEEAEAFFRGRSI